LEPRPQLARDDQERGDVKNEMMLGPSHYALGLVPAGGAFQRPEDTLIRAHMSEPLTGTAGVTFEVLGPDGPVSGIVRYYATGIQSPWTPWVLQFEPAGPLETDAIYTATVTGAWDEYGNRMVEAHRWSFGTRTTLRFAPLATSPPPGSVAVPLSATLAITFNKPLLAESEGLVSFALDRIDGSMREMVTGTVALAGISGSFR